MYIKSGRKNGMNLFWYLISFTKFYWNFQINCYLFVIQGKKNNNTVLNRLRIGHSYLTHSFILRKEEAPVCSACNAVITVKHILIGCADLSEISKKYFEERSLYSLFRNVMTEFFFDFLREIGMFHKIWSVLRKCLCEVFLKRCFQFFVLRFKIYLMNN